MLMPFIHTGDVEIVKLKKKDNKDNNNQNNHWINYFK